MTRQTKGYIGFSILAIIFGIITLPFMIAREYYQYKKYLQPCGLAFEWDDVCAYGMFIGALSLIHVCIVNLLDAPVWAML